MGSIKSIACITVDNTLACKTCLFGCILFLLLACCCRYGMKCNNVVLYLRHCGLWDPSAVWPWGEGRGSMGLFPVAHTQWWDVMNVHSKRETVKNGFFATWTYIYSIYVPVCTVCVCFFFLFHLSLLLSVLGPSVSRFVKPVCLFSSKVVGFGDKEKQALFENQSENLQVFILLYTISLFSSYKGDYMPISTFLFMKSLCKLVTKIKNMRKSMVRKTGLIHCFTLMWKGEMSIIK